MEKTAPERSSQEDSGEEKNGTGSNAAKLEIQFPLAQNCVNALRDYSMDRWP